MLSQHCLAVADGFYLPPDTYHPSTRLQLPLCAASTLFPLCLSTRILTLVSFLSRVSASTRFSASSQLRAIRFHADSLSRC